MCSKSIEVRTRCFQDTHADRQTDRQTDRIEMEGGTLMMDHDDGLPSDCRPRGRPRTTRLRGIAADEQSVNIGIHSAWQ